MYNRRMFETFFIMAQDIPSNTVRGEYNLYLVLLSYLVAALASYTGLTLANKIFLAKDNHVKNLLHIGGALALGSGIWSMHFIGMLAYNIKSPVRFDPDYTILSIVIAILSAFAALSVARSKTLKWRHVAISAVLLGTTICLMHYVGMHAMQMDAILRYEPILFTLSLLVAIMASAIALALIFYFGRHKNSYIVYLRILAALILGLGVCGMHFTGMAAANFLPTDAVCRITDVDVTQGMNTGILALIVTLITGFVVILAMTVGIYNQEQKALTDVEKSDVFPIRLITICICLTFFAILTLGALSGHIAYKVQEQNTKDKRIHELALDYLAVDKKLSNALSLFVMTRDRTWGNAYLGFAFEQQRVMRQLKSLMSDGSENQFSDFDLSEERRARVDRQILSLVGGGSHEPAITLIRSKEYQALKTRYEEQLEMAIDKAAVPVRAKIKQYIDYEYIILFLASISAVVLSLLWYFALRGVKRWQRLLIKSRNDLNDRYAEKEKLETRMGTYIEEVKRARDRALRAMHDSEHANKAKTDFLTNMSHELRTPMNSILGLTEILLKNDKTLPEHKELLAVILEAGETLLKIVNDVLDLAKIEAEGLVLQRRPFNLTSMLTNVSNTLKPIADEKNITFIQKFDVGELHLNEDEVRLSRIFTNLLGNAIKYTDDGSVRFEVQIEEEDRHHLLRAAVVDTGIGIPQDKIHSIFEKFSQADNSITRKYGGTGLGLAITKELVELMNGEIGVDSKPGEGSKFWVEIPVLLADQNMTGAKTRPIRIKAFTHEGRIPIEKARILVAEDHPLNRVFMQTLFSEMGFESVDIADNGLEVIDKVMAGKIDLVLMDCQMPEMNGFEATKKIRGHESIEGGHLPIIAMTARAMVGDRESCLEAGMDDYISKPVDLESLRKILSRWIVMEKGQ
ncbi:MAG: hypothetical protein DI586_00730 [Micavibrio aeruginosavorus]|uniref:histidine kinase n=1 Tax=Micavibrio aeruginosavorus TaxID=349221 RepID=A0A2W5FQQ4_9BACT|nr:MAG: hypothetical protein DI586_00730 [Micavibrio aeruginosavorus]